jgi:hypothetical protein
MPKVERHVRVSGGLLRWSAVRAGRIWRPSLLLPARRRSDLRAGGGSVHRQRRLLPRLELHHADRLDGRVVQHSSPAPRLGWHPRQWWRLFWRHRERGRRGWHHVCGWRRRNDLHGRRGWRGWHDLRRWLGRNGRRVLTLRPEMHHNGELLQRRPVHERDLLHPHPLRTVGIGSTMNRRHGARPRRLSRVQSALLVLLSSTTAFAALQGCGSSDNVGGGSRIINTTPSTGGSGQGAASGAGGSKALFKDGGGFIVDSGSRRIEPDAACGKSTIVATPREVSILLVIDESGSMTEKPAGFTVDKWSALKTALGGALSAVKNDIAFGLELFPYPADPKNPIPVSCTTNCCEMPAAPGINIPIGPGVTSVPKIVSAIGATSPGGGTPTALALQRALDYFKSGGGANLGGDRYVLLATDGGPNCNDTLVCDATTCTTNLDGKCTVTNAGNCCDPSFGGASRCLDDGATKAAIDALGAAGVKTFVVGIPGSEAYKSFLDAFAQAGGEVNPSAPPKYFAVSASGGAAELASVLGSITQNLVTTCSLVLTSDPPEHDLLNVEVDGRLIPRGTDGWHLDESTTPPTVVLDGATCAAVKADGAQRVQIVYGCPTKIR